MYLELFELIVFFSLQAIYERRQAIVPDFEALHQQRRLYVEARLAEVASAGGATTAPGGVTDSHTPHHSRQHHRRRFGEDFFEDDDEEVEEDDEVAGGGGGEGAIETGSTASEQIHLQRTSGGVVASGSDITPGDTQHYARAAASRGFVVPGGPGGLLRHSASSVHHQAMKMTVEGAMGEAAENASAAAAISGSGDGNGGADGSGSGAGRLFEVGEDDDSDVDMAEVEEEEDEDPEDDDEEEDEDMEDVQDNLKS